MADGFKTCSYCKTERSLSFFAKNVRATDRLCSKCKVCQKAYNDGNKEMKAATGKAYREQNAEAVRAKKKAWVQANREWKRENNRKWAEANPEKQRQSLMDWKTRNPGRATLLRKRWDEKNPERAKALEKQSRIRNKHKIAERLAARRAALIQATPAWANKKKIQEFYKTADALGMWTGEWYHVDHIVPLRGRTVAGFHVEHNLQILTQSENCKKHASWWPQMPERLLHG